MEKINLMNKYPVYVKEIKKTQTKFKNIDEFIETLKEKIEEDPIATYIWVFDHFAHTKKLGWEIPEWMIAGKILLFCFWQNIPSPQAMAVRPRNIAIAEFNDKFVVSFLEAPVEKANTKKINWIVEHMEE
jgi:hypothetical protein